MGRAISSCRTSSTSCWGDAVPTGIWTSFLLMLAGGTTLAWLVAHVHESGVRGLGAFFGRQSKIGRVLFGAFFVATWIVAGSKPDGGAGRPALSDANSVGRDVPVAPQTAIRPHGGFISPSRRRHPHQRGYTNGKRRAPAILHGRLTAKRQGQFDETGRTSMAARYTSASAPVSNDGILNVLTCRRRYSFACSR